MQDDYIKHKVEKKREWREKNKEKVKEQNRRYYEEHKEELITKRREYQKEWYKKNKEKKKSQPYEYHKEWREKNKEKWDGYQNKWKTKRAEQLNKENPTTRTKPTVFLLKNRLNGKYRIVSRTSGYMGLLHGLYNVYDYNIICIRECENDTERKRYVNKVHAFIPWEEHSPNQYGRKKCREMEMHEYDIECIKEILNEPKESSPKLPEKAHIPLPEQWIRQGRSEYICI